MNVNIFVTWITSQVNGRAVNCVNITHRTATLRLQTISVGNQIQSVTKPKTLHIHIFSWTAAKLTNASVTDRFKLRHDGPYNKHLVTSQHSITRTDQTDR